MISNIYQLICSYCWFYSHCQCQLYHITMRAVVFSLAVLLGYLISTTKTFAPKVGPFDIVVQKLTDCEDKGTNQIQFGTRINSKGNGKFVLNDDIVFLVPWDDSLKLDVEVQQLNNGVYRPRYITQSFKTCANVLKVGKDTAVSLFKAAGHDFTCPLPVGKYSVKDWPLDIKLNNIPVMMYNSYRAIFSFSKAGKRVGCVMVYADLVPKQ